MSRLDRRQFMSRSAKLLMLRSLATGLPPAFLIRGARADTPTGATTPQTLIFCNAQSGDPMNVNAPGSYVAGAENNPNPSMAPTDFLLGDTMVTAAAPWATLPQSLRDRMCFFHHRTRAAAHIEHPAVIGLQGAVRNEAGNAGEQLPSLVAQLTNATLGTLQTEPIPLDGSLTVDSRPLQQISPTALSALFDGTDADVADLRTLRDQALDSLYADLKTNGTRSQKTFLDRYILSRDQARVLGEQLAGLLDGIGADPDNIDGPADQVIAALALAKLKVAPVISIDIPFGGDNHADAELTDEATQTVDGVGHIGALWDGLQQLEMQDDVTFAMLNVFGRGFIRNSAGGRDHHRNHGVMMAFGAGVRPGVIGGVDGALTATNVDPITGAMTASGGIDAEETLEAAGRSLLVAMGIDKETVDSRVTPGPIVDAFVAN